MFQLKVIYEKACFVKFSRLEFPEFLVGPVPRTGYYWADEDIGPYVFAKATESYRSLPAADSCGKRYSFWMGGENEREADGPLCEATQPPDPGHPAYG